MEPVHLVWLGHRILASSMSSTTHRQSTRARWTSFWALDRRAVTDYALGTTASSRVGDGAAADHHHHRHRGREREAMAVVLLEAIRWTTKVPRHCQESADQVDRVNPRG